MRSISAIILALMLVSLPSCKFLRENVFGRKARLQAEIQARRDSIRVVDSIKKVQERLLALERARLDSLQRVEEERQIDKTRYNIIVGSFLTPEYARSLANEYTGMGYNVRILKSDDSRFELVAAEGHQSLRTAIRRLGQFQDTVQVESWLYIAE